MANLGYLVEKNTKDQSTYWEDIKPIKTTLHQLVYFAQKEIQGGHPQKMVKFVSLLKLSETMVYWV